MTEENKGKINADLPCIQVSGTMHHEYEVLLTRANDDLMRNEYSLSIIMSHAAIELCTERAFKLLFYFKNIEYLYDAIVRPSWKFNNLSKNNHQVRKLFSALTNESFNNTSSLWNDLEKHFIRRHGIAHRGVSSSKDEAKHSYSVAERYIRHIDGVLESVKPSD